MDKTRLGFWMTTCPPFSMGMMLDKGVYSTVMRRLFLNLDWSLHNWAPRIICIRVGSRFSGGIQTTCPDG